ncbi:MAG: hypothetical protein NZM65_03135, partial [Flavobacteriales bacterium]|nr:hypothetical protein [Flavobacteriales bacterium]MDW8409664.1 hypothetical protein [Flavobacteriales bacterium]
MVGINRLGAQENIPFKRRYFPRKGRELEAAFQAFQTGQKIVKEAYRQQSRGLLWDALPYLRQAAQFNPSHFTLNYLLGLVHFNLSHYDSSIYYLSRLPEEPREGLHADYHLLMACALRRVEHYEQANRFLQLFKEFSKGEKVVLVSGQVIDVAEEEKYLAFALSLSASSSNYRRQSLSELLGANVRLQGFPIFTALGRGVLMTGLWTLPSPGGFLQAGIWKPSLQNFEEVIPSDSLTANIQFTWISDNEQYVLGTRPNKEGDRDLFGLRRTTNGWEEWKLPGELARSPYDEICGAFSTDLSIFYFVSNRPGGVGGYDIYACKRLPNGSFTPPYNLGRAINTEKNEYWIFPHYDLTTLYFSSEGHQSLGGADIFVTKKQGDVWAAPVNPGIVLNSPFDEVAITTDVSAQTFYVYRQNRETNVDETLVFFRPHPFSRPILFAEVPLFEGNIVKVPLQFSLPPAWEEFPAVVGFQCVLKNLISSSSPVFLQVRDTAGSLSREILLLPQRDTLFFTLPAGKGAFFSVLLRGHGPWIQFLPVDTLARFGYV